MPEEARISFYRIEKCGYYRYNENTPEFGSINDILSQLQGWVTQPECVLGETCTYEIEDGENVLHTYCFNLVSNGATNDYLLTTWNEIPSVEGQVASVNANQAVGNAVVNLSEIDEGNIPGYATYFWFIPSRNTFATVCFHHALNGHRNLQKYLKEYLAKFTNYVIGAENEDGIMAIEGYALPGGQMLNVRPSFVSCLYRRPSRLQYLRNNRAFIRKIIRKNRLSPDVPENRNLFSWMLRNLGIIQEEPIQNDVRVKYELDHTPDAEELEAIIEDWIAEHDSRWDDVGFQLEGEQSPFWLSHSVAKTKFDLNIQRDNAEIINAESLLEALTDNRAEILNLIAQPG